MKTIKDFFAVRPETQSSSLKRKASKLDELPPNDTDVHFLTSSPSLPQSSLLKMIVTPNAILSPHPKESSSSSLPRKEQMYLDFGQSSFGTRRICKQCNMMIVNGHPEDEASHISICNSYLLGVPFQLQRQYVAPNCVHMLKREDALNQDDWILQVRASDALSLKRKVLEVSVIVDEELGFIRDEPSMHLKRGSRSNHNRACSDDFDHIFGNGRHIFMYISNKRVVGYCSVQVISKAYLLLNASGEKNINISPASNGMRQNHHFFYTETNRPRKAMIGVHQIWCHSDHRKKGIARSMMDIARRGLVYGMIVPKSMIAFSSPTTEGAQFAKSYCGTDFPLVYDFCS